MHRMRKTVSRFIPFALSALLVCSLRVAPLSAQDKPATATPQETARAAYSRGVEAYSAEKYQAAYEQFSLAEEAFPSPNIELMLGRSLSKLGRFVEAKAMLQRAQAGSTAPKYANTANLAATELTTVETQLARVELEIENAQGDETLLINGKPVEPAALHAPIVLDPGPVKLELSRPGAVTPTVRQLSLAAGATERVPMKVIVPEPAAVAAQAESLPAEPSVPITNPTEPPSTEDRSRSPWLRGFSYALAGAGVAGFAGFAGFGAYSHGHYTKLEELCPQGGGCHPSYQWLATKGRTYQTLANVSLVAGGVLLATGVTLWIVSLSPGRSEVAVTSSGVRIAGSF